MPTRDEILARRNELLDRSIASEIAAYDFLRPPWVLYPGEHPFSIAWRMGNGEHQIMCWTRWLEGRDAGEVVAALQHFGAIPADWAWWAAEVLRLMAPGDGYVEDAYEVPFQQVREKLAAMGLAVNGEPSSE
ncbi:hypothetical protein LZC95_19520 [Pendulispora brunnea]|uniref:Uncharacterized protein n=1 Tax=Pendulispora brunnea TaxID=2905690 RepID=A0ABZ2KK00_9BACT